MTTQGKRREEGEERKKGRKGRGRMRGRQRNGSKVEKQKEQVIATKTGRKSKKVRE